MHTQLSFCLMSAHQHETRNLSLTQLPSGSVTVTPSLSAVKISTAPDTMSIQATPTISEASIASITTKVEVHRPDPPEPKRRRLTFEPPPT